MIVIKLDGVVGKEIISKDVVSKIKASVGDIEIHVNSAGGVLYDGIQIFNAIKNYANGKITVVAGALVGSIASYFAMAGDEFIVQDNSTFMIHNAHTVSQGDYNSFATTAKTLEGVTQLLRNAYVSKSGKSMEAIKAMLDKETYLFGSQIVSEGFADKLLVSGGEISAIVAVDEAKETIITCANNCNHRFESDSDKISALLSDDKEQKELRDKQNQILKEVGIL